MFEYFPLLLSIGTRACVPRELCKPTATLTNACNEESLQMRSQISNLTYDSFLSPYDLFGFWVLTVSYHLARY